MHQMPVAAESVFARVLAHGRDEYPVGKTDPGQLDGGKQQRSICGQNGLAQNKAKLNASVVKMHRASESRSFASPVAPEGLFWGTRKGRYAYIQRREKT